MDKDQFQYAFAVNALGTENPNLKTTDKTIVGSINELLDKKQDKIIWKEVGTKISDIQINYNFIINNTYKIKYTWGKNDTAIMYKYFTYTGISTILETIYVDEDTYTQLHVSSSNKAYIVNSSGLKEVLISLEETSQKDFFNIEFKENPIPPTPCPCPKWKEVGTKEDNKTIKYNFIKNKRYRIYYNFTPTNDNTKSSWICTEFIYVNTTQYLNCMITQDYIYIWLQLNIYSIFLTTAPYPHLYGKILKLEELQE